MHQAGVYVALVVLITLCGFHASESAGVSKEPTPWVTCWFHKENVDFSNQSLIIQNLAETEGLKCWIEDITKFPNCSESVYFFAPNKTYLEVTMKHTGKIELHLAYGKGQQGGNLQGGDQQGGDLPGGDQPGGDLPGGDLPGGDLPGGDLQGTCGERMTEKEATEKISEYKTPNDSSVDHTPIQYKDENKTLSERQIIGIAVGVLLGIIILFGMYAFWKKNKSLAAGSLPASLAL